MALSIRLPNDEQVLLERAAHALRVSKSEFVRRSIAAYAARVVPNARVATEIDAQFIGKGGGLRKPASVARPRQRAIVERLREKHGYAG